MTKLSVNLNKIAWLRNSRGRDYPNVVAYAKKFIELGVHGITVHPRPDERHIKRNDVYALAELLRDYENVEYNIEGYPTADFLDMVEKVRPHQATLVPDHPDQLTSDHGRQVGECAPLLTKCQKRLRDNGIRSALFLDPDQQQVRASAELGYDRIELYTEQFAHTYHTHTAGQVFEEYKEAASYAQSLGLGVNAGHDLDLSNLKKFLSIGHILEVSIGHALTVECIDNGMVSTVGQYLEICRNAEVNLPT